MQFLPENLYWLQPVLVAALVVFVVDLIGNMLTFSSRFLNAFVTAVLFAIIFGALVRSNMGGVRMELPSSAQIGEKARELKDKAMDRVNEMKGAPDTPAAPTAPKQ